MFPRPWSSTRRLCAGLQIGAVAALTLFAPVLLPSRAVFAHEALRSTTPTTTAPSAKPAGESRSTWRDAGNHARGPGSTAAADITISC